MTELESEPGNAWMIGDSPVDVKTARAAGVRVAGVTWGLDPKASARRDPIASFMTRGISPLSGGYEANPSDVAVLGFPAK